jgi:starch phosphorylase
MVRLAELARNLWWTWNPAAGALFRDLDPVQWRQCGHNPPRMLADISLDRLQMLCSNDEYLARCGAVLDQFDAYMSPDADTWFKRVHPADDRRIAYFCAEFGLHESLPIYSGGLGVLAGDHCKTASDLGLPFIAVGLWYGHGYFHQKVDLDGRQVAEPENIDPRYLPALSARTSGDDLIIKVPIAGRQVAALVRRLQVGRIPIYLLDPDLPDNSAADRALCAQLYGGDRETRLAQELLLGIGGVIALRALGISPTIWHMNEGHAAFMGLERIRELVGAGHDFTQAWPAQAENSVFTTHTPVPAGNEVFRSESVARYLPDMPGGLGLALQGMLDLGHEENAPAETFAMTPLALRLSHHANGVSALHGEVARRMWWKQFPGRSLEEVPITSVTNGVHTATWIGDPLRTVLDRYLGADWLERPDDPEPWEGLGRIPDRELWEAHLAQKTALGIVVADRVVGPLSASGPSVDPTVLTIGFARRFATYKRATLFFHDFDRAVAILTNRQRPVQLIFAGKAHPADAGGQAFIRQIVQLARQPELHGKILFLEGYDLALGRAMVQGVDLWLNNPERPQEASGTSGQKAGLNGIPNCSIRDGWWDEGYQAGNGWAFGGASGNDDEDSAQLYEVLEQEVIPMFYNQDQDGLSAQWLAVMRASMRSVGSTFSAHRMVKEYVERLYHPA